MGPPPPRAAANPVKLHARIAGPRLQIEARAMSESPEHIALVELFRHHPGLAARLAAQTGQVELPPEYTARVGDPIEKPSSLAPDVVRLTIIVEIQRREDPDKLFTWPVYLWLERLRRRCECVILVIATRRDVAAWAAGPIRGGPGNLARMFVLGPDEMPWVADLDEARTDPAFAVLSSSLHARDPDGIRVVRAALAGLFSLRLADTCSYNQLVFRAVDAATFPDLEDLMPQPQTAQDPAHVEEWREFIQPYIKNLTEWVVGCTARQEVLVELIGERGMTLDEQHRTRIRRCGNRKQLDTWLRRVLTAASVDEIFAD